ncbi:cation-transporting P-type ATPase [Candidatus Falkowbacteria bacterium]|nr:cation-transporting P-type ATPase [Candidatus Falkowbacteria bacterium]
MDKTIYGLSSNEVKLRFIKFGPNIIFKPEKVSFLGIAKQEIFEPMILLLFVVGFFYSIWGKLEDAFTIFAVIFLLVLAEIYNEYRAKKAIASLEKISSPKTKVLRSGGIVEIDAEKVVSGDFLVLSSGTKISADAKIKKSVGLECDESALTGESFPQNKKEGDEIFAGAIITSGEGIAEVATIGVNTRIGQIAGASKKIKPPKTPLQLAMKSLAGKLVFVAVFFSILIPVIGFFQGRDLKAMILTGLSLSFATIPEELPIIITMVLGLGALTLSKNKFLVKKIKAAETLGSATVIVTDKTGTITENKLKITEIYPEDEKMIIKKSFYALSEYSLSPIEQEIKNKAGEFDIEKAPEAIRQRNFGEEGKKTKAILRKIGGDYELFVLGAPEEIFINCQNLPDDTQKELARQTEKGRRVIAIAHRKISPDLIKKDFFQLEKELNFAGLISFEDPPREGVKETIAQMALASVRTIMVTGDHPQTASFIAGEIGIANQKIITGEDMNKLSDDELRESVKKVSVFARATPQHKYRIVEALQKNGEVVAATGDGINDALALKAADIGIAMGIRGTDVAKEAAEVILADDNFITIAQGIFEGRKFFDNLQKGIKYYLSVKFALILIFLLPIIMRIPLPFSPIQIIILELFMDLAASAGFINEPQEKNIYSRPPRNPKENILTGKAIADILIKGLALFAAVIFIYFYALSENLDTVKAQTFAFSAWIFGHIILAYISRSDKKSIFHLGIFTNIIINFWTIAAISFLLAAIYIQTLSEKFNLTAVKLSHLALVALATISIIIILEIKKR